MPMNSFCRIREVPVAWESLLKLDGGGERRWHEQRLGEKKKRTAGLPGNSSVVVSRRGKGNDNNTGNKEEWMNQQDWNYLLPRQDKTL